MRTRAVWWMAALAVGLMGAGAGYAQIGQNQLTNGGFESGSIAPYGTYGTVTPTVVTECEGAAVPEGPIEGKYCLHVVVPAAGANSWDMGMTDGSHSFEQGKKYTFCCFMKTKSGTLQVRLKPERGADPWEAYNESVVTVTEQWQEFTVTTPVITATVTPASPTFHFGFTAGDFWIDGVRLYEGDYVPPAFLKDFAAQEPAPADDAIDVPREIVLSWEAGPFAATHDVYLGETFDDVNNASVGNPGNVLVSQGQSGTTFDPDALEFSKTYYWRVDEVNAAPDSTVYQGRVWRFTVEPYAYTVTGVKVTASSAAPDMAPERTVDGSGLSADGLHSSTDTDMWLTGSGQTLPAWIQYDLGQACRLLNMTIWNSNQKVEPFIGFGAKGITIEYSLDGATWSTVGDIELAQANGTDSYAGQMVDLANIEAKFVRLVIQSNWGGFIPQAGLSEVRFLYVPVKARAFAPAIGAEEQPLDATLVWRPGREAVSHEVLFSDDVQAVADGTAAVESVNTNEYQPNGLEYGKTYYWKVNEVGDDGSWEGDVWSFSTTEFAAVDDMESYNDDDNRIYDAWIDGWVNSTGSQVGYDAAPFAEMMIVHAGRQSMPLQYDNSAAPFLSEADHTFASAQDWTANGADTLSLFFHGAAPAEGDPVERLYVTVKDSSGKLKTVTHPDAMATAGMDWQEWRIPLSEFSSAGVKVTAVKALTIGVGNKTSPAKGGAGIVYIDDVRIGRHGSSDPGTGVAYYALENDVLDGSGNGHDGAAFGNPVYIDGPAGLGKALQFSGLAGSYVDIGTWNPSAATGRLSVSLWAKWAGLTAYWQGLIGKRDTWAVEDMMWQIEANQTTGVLRFQRANNDIVATTIPTGEWTHVLVTFDGATAKIYVNGSVAGQGAFSFGTDAEAVMQFGSSAPNGGNPFNGAMDEIRLYDRVLSAFEISYLGGN